jgi:integrase
MANIEKRLKKDGSTVYRVKVRLKGNPSQSATFERITDAKKWVQNVESDIRAGRHFQTTEAKRHSFAELIDRYLRDVLPQKSDVMQSDQYRHLQWWKEQLGHKSLADINPINISECRDRLLREPGSKKKKRSPATVVRYMAALSHALTVSVQEWGWLDDSPMRKVSKPKEPRGRVRLLDECERERLMQACKEGSDRNLYTIVILALSTGARKSEILNLEWGDIDLNREVPVAILHKTKNDERRALPLAGHALELVRDLAKVRRLDTNLLFPDSSGKKPINIRAAWEKALKKADVNDFRFHDLRHSAASYLAMNGASLAEIAEVLGHKTLQMVKRYSHLTDQHTASVVSRMNKKIFG